MLQAQNGRQFNLAAKVVCSFLAEKNISLKQSEALELVSRLTGHASYAAAKALLEGQAKGVSSKVSTWRQLGHAIGTLDDEQLDMQVHLTEGCDSDGNATFAQAAQLVLANDGCLAAGTTMFSNKQPILRFEEFNPGIESDEGRRIICQFETESGESGSIAEHAIMEYGLENAVGWLNDRFSTHISLESLIAYCASENRYFTVGHGFVSDKFSATGFSKEDRTPEDCVLIPYETAQSYL